MPPRVSTIASAPARSAGRCRRSIGGYDGGDAGRSHFYAIQLRWWPAVKWIAPGATLLVIFWFSAGATMSQTKPTPG